MSEANFRMRIGSWAGMLMLLAAGPLLGQAQSGDLYGSVVDPAGQPIPGVTVTVSGIGAPRIQQSNAQGEFRFLGLDPGDHGLRAELANFSTIEFQKINIRVGRTTTIEITMTPAVEAVIEVTSESPLLDARKDVKGTQVTQVELERIPTSRDPWAILSQAPGVQTDRINVGGNESGQQSIFVGTGSASSENAFAVDGVVITDMAAIGASPTYYDFDSFEEVQLATGGTDVSKATSGVSVNLVTKRGTNEWRGSARYFLTDDGYQSSTGADPKDFPPGQAVVAANRIVDIEDFGAEIGGALVENRLWIWGGFGKNEINQSTFGGDPDNTILESTNAKVNAQIATPNSAVFQASRGDKIKNGRDAGPSRAAETTWNQSGPTEIWKLEDTHVFSSNFYLTGLYSFVDGGFALAPQGGLATDARIGSDGVWRGSFLDFSSDRDVDQYRLDGSYFFNTGGSTHELKFGGGFRQAETVSPRQWPGRGIVHVAGEVFGAADPVEFFIAARPGRPAATSEYTSFWAQDTLSRGNLTVNFGFRYDLQEGANDPSRVAANPVLPEALPALDFPGNDAGGFEWETLSPRLGATYALGPERKTLVRGSLSRYAQQLGQGLLFEMNPTAASYLYYAFIDEGNEIFDGDEPRIFLFPDNVDPADPGSLVPTSVNDPDLSASLTDEVTGSVEHAFLPELVVGLHLTYRGVTDIIENRPFVVDGAGNVFVASRGDYVLDGFVTGTVAIPGESAQAYNQPVFTLRPGLALTGGSFSTNGLREQEYLGTSLTFTKRLANRWMLRGNATLTDWTWKLSEAALRFDDPTDTVDPTDNDGEVVGEQSGGSGNKGGIWLNSRWSFNVNGMYQVAPDRPWGFNLAANVSGREGFPNPTFHNRTAADGVTRSVATGAFDQVRNDDIFTVDARIDKDFELGDFGFTVSVDAFNIFNEGYVLQRERSQTAGRRNFVNEVLSPRIVRLGVRLNWK